MGSRVSGCEEWVVEEESSEGTGVLSLGRCRLRFRRKNQRRRQLVEVWLEGSSVWPGVESRRGRRGGGIPPKDSLGRWKRVSLAHRTLLEEGNPRWRSLRGALLASAVELGESFPGGLVAGAVGPCGNRTAISKGLVGRGRRGRFPSPLWEPGSGFHRGRQGRQAPRPFSRSGRLDRYEVVVGRRREA